MRSNSLLVLTSALLGIGLIYALYNTAVSTIKPLPPTASIDSIVVVKHDRLMYVFEDGQLLRSYKVALGGEPVGHKLFEGDNRTPEGLYLINGKNPHSSYHKNLGISYPSDKDRQAAKRLRKSPGGDIKIHGLPNGKGYIGSAHTARDWTLGCIAVTNEEIDELFNHVSVGTPINILP